MAHLGPILDHMGTRLEAAVADEVLILATRNRLKHNEIQQRAGINDRTWRRYFVERSRPVPVPVLMAVADALGVLPEDLFAAARARLAQEDAPAPTFSEHVTRFASPEVQEQIRRARAEKEAEEGDENPV